MRLYLVRHAHATTHEEDPLRPLSERGRDVARKVARWLSDTLADTPGLILHSPLARSRETAMIIASELKAEDRLEEVDTLLPEDDPLDTLALLARDERSILVVGHEPHLARLASLLLLGDRDRPLILLKKGAVCCLKSFGQGEGPWIIEWSVKPRLL
jgi:phosphohistidine phosphatase